ncbi:hypothetical protein BGC_65460 [Burkholderia sp. 3C]
MYIIERFAAKRGMAAVPSGEWSGAARQARRRAGAAAKNQRFTSFAGVSQTASAPITSMPASMYMPDAVLWVASRR